MQGAWIARKAEEIQGYANRTQRHNRSRDLFAAEVINFGLPINTDKTVVMHQSSAKAEYNTRRITVNGNQLQTVNNFAYLESTLTQHKHRRRGCPSVLLTPSAGCKPPCGVVTAFN
nr:unnamed protein product [Spirometra erinaceieuropaei]